MNKPFVPRGRFAQQSAATGRTPPEPAIQHLSHVTHKGPVYLEKPALDLAQPEKRAIASMSPAMAAYFEKKRTKTFVPSEQGAEFLKWVTHGSGNAILVAGAGCGKTTILIEGLKLMEGTVFFGAYNKPAADDIRDKARKARVDRRGVKISTLHAAALYDFRQAFPKGTVDDRKVHKIIDDYKHGRDDALLIEQSRGFISRMVGFGKQFLMGCKGKPAVTYLPAWLGICEHFSVDMDLLEDVEVEQAMAWVVEVFNRSRIACSSPGVLDFDDMLYAPIAYGVRVFKNDWVLIDEAQDLNPARREYAKRLLKAGGRAIFVGDNRQSIYGFTGAGGDSIDRIKEEFSAQILPLTVTYRCPKAVVSYVHQWVGAEHIQAHPSAPDGVLRAVNYKPSGPCPACGGTGKAKAPFSEFAPCSACSSDGTKVKGTGIIAAGSWFKQDPPNKEDVVLCRYTRPLIQTAYAMIKEGIACRVAGRDIGLGLITLARTWKISTLARLEERLATYLKRELEKAAKSQSERRAQEVRDRVDTLCIFIERCKALNKRSIEELVAEIETMFADEVRDVLELSTGHKSKGREWPRVFWLTTTRRGRSKKEWENIQEDNINYVIGTRAMRELILVPEILN